MSFGRQVRIGCLYPIGILFLFVAMASVAEMTYHSIRLSQMQALLPKVLAEETTDFYVKVLGGDIVSGSGSADYCSFHAVMVARVRPKAEAKLDEIAARVRAARLPSPLTAASDWRMKVHAEVGERHIVITLEDYDDHFGLDWRCRCWPVYPIAKER